MDMKKGKGTYRQGKLKRDKIKELRKDLKSLTKQYKSPKPEEKEPLLELRNIIRSKMRSLQSVEWHR